jgi:hypothetical protein
MSEQQSSADSAAALRLLAAEDERQSKLHELLETIREQIRLEVAPEHRPEGLFKNIQDAVYAMRGRTRLMDDAAITHVLTEPQSAPKLEALESCKGEQLKFEEWAAAEKYDMHEHPLHYLFMDDKTNAARQGWKAALRYATTAIAGTQSQAVSAK